MITHKKLSLVFIFAGALIAPVAHGMRLGQKVSQYAKNKWQQELNFARSLPKKKAFTHYAGRGLHWGLVLGPSSYEGYRRIKGNDPAVKTTMSVPDEVIKEFAYEEIRQACPDKEHLITIHHKRGGLSVPLEIGHINACAGAFSDGTYFIQFDTSYLQQLLADREQCIRDNYIHRVMVLVDNGNGWIVHDADEIEKIDRELDGIRGILNHEINHIKNKDNFHFGIACIAIPFLTHPIFRGMSILLKPTTLSTSIPLFKSCLTAFGKDTTNTQIRMAYQRHREQQADDNVQAKKSYLTGLARTLRLHHAFKEEQLSITNPSAVALIRIESLSHPHPLKRAEKLERRAAALADAEQTTNAQKTLQAQAEQQ